jgi:uncharacterized protein (DUF1684 family)
MSERTTYEEEVESLMQRRVERLRSGTGWLSLVDKVFLSPGTSELKLPDGSIEGPLVVEGTRVELGGRVLKSDKEGPADKININGFIVELMERGDSLALRIRDHRELPRPSAGIARFPIDVAWKKTARLERWPEPKKLLLDFEGATASGGVTDEFVSPGRLVFEHEGREHALEAVWEGHDETRLMVLFRDGTSGKESYPLGRFVYANPPDGNGVVVLDFNVAMLPGCAFSVYATCPIASKENKLAIDVRAGERHYEGSAVGEPAPALVSDMPQP